MPYASPADLFGRPIRQEPQAGGGLGLINATDWWRTGRPAGLPGTTTLRLMRDGDKWNTGLVGAGLGLDVDEETAKAQKRFGIGMLMFGVSAAVVATMTTVTAVTFMRAVRK